jgi:hypothetical protein
VDAGPTALAGDIEYGIAAPIEFAPNQKIIESEAGMRI